MYKITAHAARRRMPSLRNGDRSRRVPVLVMSDGSAIKLKPGKPVVVSEEVYNNNQMLIGELAHCMDIVKLGESLPPIVTVSIPEPEPVPEPETEPDPEPVPEPETEPDPEPVPEPETDPVKEPKTRTRRKVTVESEEAPKAKKRRRRTKKAD